MALALPNKDKHAKIWNAIFKDNLWLSFVYAKGINIILIGCDLLRLYEAEDISKCEPAYLILHCGYQRESHDFNRELLSQSLRPWTWIDYSEYKYNDHGPKEESEIAFLENRIILNIQHPWGPPGDPVVSRPLKLISEQDSVLHSAYIHWKDDGFAVRAIDPKHMTKTSLKEIAHKPLPSIFFMLLPATRKTSSDLQNYVLLELVPIGGRNGAMVSWYGMPETWWVPGC